MTSQPSNPGSFRQRFLKFEVLLGSFIKTPTTHAIEIMGGLGFDFVVLDAEHAPWDRASLDNGLLAARATAVAGIVRVAEPSAAHLLAALDDGAAGVLVPHVKSAAMAREVVAACRYRGGKRGFSNSPRAGAYGERGMWEHVDQADAGVTVIAMIEDPEALEAIEDIIAVAGLDGVFIGRGDLAVALGASGPNAPLIRAAAEKVIAAASHAEKPVCIMVADAEEARQWQLLGASAFIVSSDQGFMRQAAAKTRQDFLSLPNP